MFHSHRKIITGKITMSLNHICMENRLVLITCSILLLVLVFGCNSNCGRCTIGDVDMLQRAEQLKELRFGMFICWSFATFADEEWPQGVTDVNLFNPSGMDTDQWAREAKNAGMGYILFLAKHHPGFCLWDSDTTDWKVTNTSLGKDVLAAMKKSCDKYGIKLALYFSEGDETWQSNNNPEMKRNSLKSC